MQDQQRDHGVAGETHWLLDEELVPRRPTHVARPLPVLLRHDAAPESAGERATEAAAPSSDAFRFALGLLAAVAIYLLLRGADVSGALPGSVPTESEGGIVVTAALTADPMARLDGAEVAALRALLASVGLREAGRAAAKPSQPAEQQVPKPPPMEEPIVTAQPPAPLPAPDPHSLLPEAPQARRVIEDLERAAGLEPATLSLEG
jgi:hypothetical protein